MFEDHLLKRCLKRSDECSQGNDPMIYAAPLLVLVLLLAPGIRLLTIASRTRQVPELFGGLYFVGASVGISFRVFGASLQQTQPELAATANLIGHLALAMGTLAIVFFTQRVFHPDNTGARLFAGLLAITIVSSTIYTVATGEIYSESSTGVLIANFSRVVPTGWAFFESFRYWRAMRLRSRIGLADPVVTNRFLLWTLWTAGITLLPGTALMLRIFGRYMMTVHGISEVEVAGHQPAVIAMVRLAFVGIVPVTVAALCLSFFPPRAYLERLKHGAANEAAALS